MMVESTLDEEENWSRISPVAALMVVPECNSSSGALHGSAMREDL
jgi:hypothetical protein